MFMLKRVKAVGSEWDFWREVLRSIPAFRGGATLGVVVVGMAVVLCC